MKVKSICWCWCVCVSEWWTTCARRNEEGKKRKQTEKENKIISGKKHSYTNSEPNCQRERSTFTENRRRQNYAEMKYHAKENMVTEKVKKKLQLFIWFLDKYLKQEKKNVFMMIK